MKFNFGKMMKKAMKVGGTTGAAVTALGASTGVAESADVANGFMAGLASALLTCAVNFIKVKFLTKA